MSPNDLDEYLGVIVGWAAAICLVLLALGVFE